MLAKNFTAGLIRRTETRNLSASVQGDWGAGKSCLLNLVRAQLAQSGNKDIRVYNFDVWLVGNLESLLVINLKALVDVLAEDSPKNSEAKKFQVKFHKALADHGDTAGTVVGFALGVLTGNPLLTAIATGSIKAATSMSKEEQKKAAAESTDVGDLRKQLTGLLDRSKLRFFLFLDEIDRLTSEEMLSLFRLVRLLSALPKVNIIAAFDPSVVDRTLNSYGGLSFADKIFLWPWRLPPSKPLPNLLHLLDRCGVAFEEFSRRGCNQTLASILNPTLCNGRTAKRLCHATMFAVEQLGRNVFFADILAVETVRLLDASLLDMVWNNSLKSDHPLAGLHPKHGPLDAGQLLSDIGGQSQHGRCHPGAAAILIWLLERKVEEQEAHVLHFNLENAEVFIRLDPTAISDQFVMAKRLLDVLAEGLQSALDLFVKAEVDPSEIAGLVSSARSLAQSNLDQAQAHTLLEVVAQRGDHILRGVMDEPGRSTWRGSAGDFRSLLSPLLRLAGPTWKAKDLVRICSYGQFQTLTCLAHDLGVQADSESTRQLSARFTDCIQSALRQAFRKRTLWLKTPLLSGVLIHAFEAGLGPNVRSWMRHHMRTPMGLGDICLGFRVRSTSHDGHRNGYQRHQICRLSGFKPDTLKARAKAALKALPVPDARPYLEVFQSIARWNGLDDTNNFGLDD